MQHKGRVVTELRGKKGRMVRTASVSVPAGTKRQCARRTLLLFGKAGMLISIAASAAFGNELSADASTVKDDIEVPGIADEDMPSELLIQRARLALQEGSESSLRQAALDFSRVIEDLDPQPFARLFRGDTFMLLGDFASAASDYSNAVSQFASIKDDASAEAARAGLALALYGQGKAKEAVAAMEKVFARAAGVNAEIEVLLPLARRMVELGVAQAALAWSKGRAAQAESAWSSACVLSDAVDEFVASGQRDPKKELAFREMFFPGSQSVQASKRPLLNVQAARSYDQSSSRIGAENPNIENGPRSRGCIKFQDVEWVGKNKGWPPALLDMLSDFMAVGAPSAA